MLLLHFQTARADGLADFALVGGDLDDLVLLVDHEGPYHLLEFRVIDQNDGIDVYWLTLQLPEPYERIESLTVLSPLTFDLVDFKARTIRFLLDFNDVVKIVDRCKSYIDEKPEKPAN
jgi:hypothetical protein